MQHAQDKRALLVDQPVVGPQRLACVQAVTQDQWADVHKAAAARALLGGRRGTESAPEPAQPVLELDPVMDAGKRNAQGPRRIGHHLEHLRLAEKKRPRERSDIRPGDPFA